MRKKVRITTISFFYIVLQFMLLLSMSSFASDVTTERKIRIGDTLQILLVEDPQFKFKGPVEDSGFITLPFLGSVEAVNLSTTELKERLTARLLEDLYQKANLSVTIVRRTSGQIYVYGAVKEPGVIQLPASGKFSVPQLLAEVKGLTGWSDPANAYLIRHSQAGSSERISVNIQDQLLNPDPAKAVFLRDGDELYVPGINQGDSSELLTSDSREIIVVGQVNSPGIQLFAPGEEATLLRAIFKAGGLTKFAQSTQVKLIRYRGSERTVEKLNAREIIEEGFLDKDVKLYAGDMIIVPQKLINF